MSNHDYEWLKQDTLRENVEALQEQAESVTGESCDAWYADQLKRILNNDE